MQLPVTVLNTNTKRETGKKAQFANIQAAKVCTCTCPSRVEHLLQQFVCRPPLRALLQLSHSCCKYLTKLVLILLYTGRCGHHSHHPGASFDVENVAGRKRW